MSAQLEEERKQYGEQLEIVVASLKDDPGNAELLSLKEELDQMINLIDDSLAELKPKTAEPSKPATSKATTPPAPPVEEKWSRENHPAFKKAPATQAPAEEKEPDTAAAVGITYQVNDNVMAKWLSGDKGFYPARITSVTGSSTNPIYTVKFKSYDTIETLRAKDIRPVATKRKADGSAVSGGVSGAGTVSYSPATAAGTATAGGGGAATAAKEPGSGVVLSAAASLYPQKAQEQMQQEAEKEEKPVKKFKKIKANKELEAGKTKWQEFNAKGKFGRGVKKDSMFRTPEGPRGRVGFTGSGQAMRKDPTRSRHVYQPNEDLD